MFSFYKKEVKKTVDYTTSSSSIINPDFSLSEERHVFAIYKLNQKISMEGINTERQSRFANAARVIFVESGSNNTRQLTAYIVNLQVGIASRIHPMPGPTWNKITFDRLDSMIDFIHDIKNSASEFKETEITNEQLTLFNNPPYIDLDGDINCDNGINRSLKGMGLSNEFSSGRVTCTIC